jgi:hypothetical protein
MGVDIEDAENVLFSNNDMFDFVRFGINIMTSNNIPIDNNWVHGIFSRHLKVYRWGDPVGGILGCAHKKNDQCVGVRITNNVVSMVEPSDVDTFGYSAMGHECGNYQDIVFRDNLAHSIHSYGAIISRMRATKCRLLQLH